MGLFDVLIGSEPSEEKPDPSKYDPTDRLKVATAIMHGMCGTTWWREDSAANMAYTAVKRADALLFELEKTARPNKIE